MKNFKWVLIASLIIMVGGCKSSHITSTWKSPEGSAKKYNKILVLGIIHEKDRRLQEKMEEHLAGDLRSLGYTAVTSLAEYGPKAFEDLSEKEAIAKLKGSEIDAVITIVLLNKTIEQQFVPTKPRPRSNFLYFGGSSQPYHHFWNYYGAVRMHVYQPGYYVDNTQYFWESNFYELGNQALVYSAQTTSFNPSTEEGLGHEYGKMIIKNLVKQNILVQQTADAKKGF